MKKAWGRGGCIEVQEMSLDLRKGVACGKKSAREAREIEVRDWSEFGTGFEMSSHYWPLEHTAWELKVRDQQIDCIDIDYVSPV